MEIVPVNLIDLKDYSTSIRTPREPRRISTQSEYLDESDINPQPTEYTIRTLEAVADETDAEVIECVDG